MTASKARGNDVVRWNPWQEMFGTRGLPQAIDSIWRAAIPAEVDMVGGELEETEKEFVLELDVPGVAKSDITIDVTGRRVSVEGKRAEKERTGVLRHSTRVSGTFSYELTLPGDIDGKAVTAHLDGGVLTIRLPKAQGTESTRVAIG